MRKEKKVKQKEKEKKSIYIIVGILAGFLLIFIIMNMLSTFRDMDTRECVRGMILMEEGMMQMEEEFHFNVTPSIEFEELATIMAYYYHFGPVVFENPTTGTLGLKPSEELVNLPRSTRESLYILDIPECPADGNYTLVKSENHPGLYDIVCSVHGRLYMPEERDGNYEFTGNLDAFSQRKTELGTEYELYFSKQEMPKEYVILEPYTEPGAEEESENGTEEPESPVAAEE